MTKTVQHLSGVIYDVFKIGGIIWIGHLLLVSKSVEWPTRASLVSWDCRTKNNNNMLSIHEPLSLEDCIVVYNQEFISLINCRLQRDAIYLIKMSSWWLCSFARTGKEEVADGLVSKVRPSFWDEGGCIEHTPSRRPGGSFRQSAWSRWHRLQLHF